MNILQVHNKYRNIGGEWTVLEQEFELLKDKHQVERFIVQNSEELKSIFRQFRLIFTTHYNKKAAKVMQRKLSDENYDLMHVHNFFPLLSPSVFDAARKAGVPTVMSLHNFRLIHPNGLMYYKGKIDERSIGGSAYRCVWDGVYRDSVFQTAVTAHMIEFHRKKKTWQRVPSAFIALSEFSKEKFVQGGLPEERIFIKPNFLNDPLKEFPDLEIKEKKKNRYLYVGRLSSEKGIQDLIECWVEHAIDAELVIAGDGPLRSKLEKKTKGNRKIRWLGQIEKPQILSLLAESKALIFPTRCYEGQPLIILEAMSMGCPVITSKIGNPQNIINHENDGLHFTPGNRDELFNQVDFMQNHPEKRKEMSRNARKSYLENYTPEKNYQILMDIYEQAAELEYQLAK
jgi:glycosyltransferase involved in cell wall biosynthesis